MEYIIPKYSWCTRIQCDIENPILSDVLSDAFKKRTEFQQQRPAIIWEFMMSIDKVFTEPVNSIEDLADFGYFGALNAASKQQWTDRKAVFKLITYIFRYLKTEYPNLHFFNGDPEMNRLIDIKDVVSFYINMNGSPDDAVKVVAKNGDGGVGRLIFLSIPYKSQYLSSLYREFAMENRSYKGLQLIKDCYKDFEADLGIETINSIADFSEALFWKQLGKYMAMDIPKSTKEKLIRHEIQFYRFLITKPGGDEILKNAQRLTGRLLSSQEFSNMILDGFKFFSSDNLPDKFSGAKAAVTLHNTAHITTRLIDHAIMILDMTAITYEKYRELAFAYIFSNKSILMSQPAHSCVRIFLMLLADRKFMMEESYDTFDSEDAAYIAEKIREQAHAPSSIAERFYNIKKFLYWCSGIGAFTLTDVELIKHYFKAPKVPANRQAEAIPYETINKVIQFFQKDADTDYIHKLYAYITVLLLITPLRLNALCTLKIQDIHSSREGDSFWIENFSKTSLGKEMRTAIPEPAYKILMQIVKESEAIRKECYYPELQNHIFIHKSKARGYTYVTGDDFRAALVWACKKLGIKKINPSNLRDTYATTAETIGGETMEAGEYTRIAMGHAESRTSKEHYIDYTFREFKDLNQVKDFGTIAMIQAMKEDMKTVEFYDNGKLVVKKTDAHE